MNIIVKGGLVFFGTLVIVFLIIYVFVNPLVQDAYKQGYERGQNEQCKPFWEVNKTNDYSFPIPDLENYYYNLS